MKSICYILFSKKLNRFYVGSTRFSAEERLEQHLSLYYENNKSFTSKAKDWEIFHLIYCDSYEQALALEKHIKKMKSKTYITNLKNNVEIIEKLKIKYGSGSLPR